MQDLEAIGVTGIVKKYHEKWVIIFDDFGDDGFFELQFNVLHPVWVKIDGLWEVIEVMANIKIEVDSWLLVIFILDVLNIE